MGGNSRVSRWGASLAIRIPKPIAEQWGVQEGSSIEIVPRGDQLVLRKEELRSGRYAGPYRTGQYSSRTGHRPGPGPRGMKGHVLLE